MKRLLLASGFAVFCLTGGEVIARYWLGLGTPPLSVTHPAIEYRFASNQNVFRFGNHQVYNEYGMRSENIDQVTQPNRVAVFGDSVLNGGNLTDHAELATTIATDREVFFGNVSAGSWGPANMVAWIEEFGLFDATTAIILIGSGDLYDVPTFAPLDPATHPTERPFSALFEGVQRYLPRYLPKFLSSAKSIPMDSKMEMENTSGAISEFIDHIGAAGVKLCAIQHRNLDELGVPPNTDMLTIRDLFSEKGIPVLDLGVAIERSTENSYRDLGHLNAHGQTLLVGYLRDCYSLAKLPS